MSQNWSEVQQVGLGTPAHPVLPLSAIAFDPYEELLWAGGENGQISSLFVGTEELSRYTAFPGHGARVQRLLIHDQGVFSIGGVNVRHNHRRGLVKWNFCLENNQSPLDMCFTNTSSELFVSISGKGLMTINFFRGNLIRQMEADSDYTVMKHGRVIVCGSTTGRVSLRDPRTLREEHTLLAHAGGISDLDISGNILVTCGFSLRNNQMIPDPMIKIFDIRTNRALPPLPCPSCPSYVQFHPQMTSTLLAATQTGQFQICDVSNTADIGFYQANVNGYLNSVSFSSSGNLLGFGDSSGVVSIWSDGADYRVNAFSRMTEFADPPAPPPNLTIGDDDPLSLVGMPYYSEQLLSAWPYKMLFEPGQPPPRVPPEVLPNVKTIDFVGYAANPGTIRRNTNVAIARKARKDRLDIPKFRSEQDREKLRRKAASKHSPQTHQLEEDLAVLSLSRTIPKYYRQVEIKYSKFGVEDFDFGFYNKTPFGGLETHITNSYCNSLLQMMFFTIPLREVLKGHIRANCPKEYCLSCELGFLFRMLEDASGLNCQATNFLRAFKTIPQASALGLFEPEQPTGATNYAALIQNFNRFVLEQIQSDLAVPAYNGVTIIKRDYDGPSPSLMQQIYGLQLQAVSHCQCNSEHTRDTYPFVVDLAYQWKGVHAKISKDSFVDVLQRSINRASSTKAWCNACKRYQPTSQYRKLRRSPNVLCINASATTEEDLDLYRSQDGDPWLPQRIAIVIQGSNMAIHRLNSDEESVPGETGDVTIYDLISTVAEIREGKQVPHLVAHIRVDDDTSPTWYVFNDFLVQPVPDLEACCFQKWKVPAVFQYRRVDLPQLENFDALPQTPNAVQLCHMSLLNRRREKDLKIRYKTLRSDELPTAPGYLCALDAEFVALTKDETEVRSDGTRSVIRPSRLTLARVSVLRGSGPDEGVPFIDEYISTTDPIVDYLTEFSGIRVGDLDINASRQPLVSLKSSYKKLRLLVDLGCIFIGHGLKKDFRIIKQVIDTVDIYFIPSRQRKLSLRFLAWAVLRQQIQTETHDSNEDARTALALYKKYIELCNENQFDAVLEDVYEEGRATGFKPPSRPPATTSGPGSSFTVAGVQVTELPP
ncbi:ubiquitin carboxyl-terminal hydrolase-domain-containing protein [Phlyctochytrium arcticum]|nr:ubiquitin carboxyl-terminal hydrolase-domain-containing protein [Phlyctochytrium arcticum]